MDRVYIFLGLQLLVSGYALLRGGAPERVTAIALTLAVLLGMVLQVSFPTRFYHVDLGVMAIDVALFGVLVALALYADRWWTLWVAAMQGLGAGAHLIKAIDSDTIRVVYAILAAAWSYPIILLLLVGTIRHQRRMARGGDLDWSAQAVTNHHRQHSGDHQI
ncbi:hypothetical protein [Sphingomonas sp.]|uniref:hypothetical protein n=1 Tax=Sphingomonas sp. TaxID=28214 RepID=UPI003D6CDB65